MIIWKEYDGGDSLRGRTNTYEININTNLSACNVPAHFSGKISISTKTTTNSLKKRIISQEWVLDFIKNSPHQLLFVGLLNSPEISHPYLTCLSSDSEEYVKECREDFKRTSAPIKEKLIKDLKKIAIEELTKIMSRTKRAISALEREV